MMQGIGESIWDGFLNAIGFPAWGWLLGWWWVPVALVAGYFLLSVLAKLKAVGGWPAVVGALLGLVAAVAGAFGFRAGHEWANSRHKPAVEPRKGRRPRPIADDSAEPGTVRPRKVMFPGLKLEDLFRRRKD
jgi:hypothetical protein